MKQFPHAECLLHVFVGIYRRNPAAGGSEFLVRKTLLFQAVHKHMIRHGDDRPVTDLQILRRDRNPLCAQFVRLLRKMFDVDDHPVAEHVDNTLAQNARRKKIENKFPPLVDDGMPRIVPALIAADDVVVFGQKIDHSALAFVTPVDPTDRSKHVFPPCARRKSLLRRH